MFLCLKKMTKFIENDLMLNNEKNYVPLSEKMTRITENDISMEKKMTQIMENDITLNNKK